MPFKAKLIACSHLDSSHPKERMAKASYEFPNHQILRDFMLIFE